MSYKDFTTTYTIPIGGIVKALRRKTPKAQLAVVEGPENLNLQKLFSIKGAMVLGRKKTADLYIDDSKLSRLHAQIFTDGRHYYLKDLNSTNGTRVNGKFITEKQLRPGDILELGDVKLEFSFSQLISKKHQASTPQTPFSKFFRALRILFFGVLLIFCLSLLYYSATKPFDAKRKPQSIELHSKKWGDTQADIFYKMSNQAYQSRDYIKAKHYWREAKKLAPTSIAFEKLGRAIDEAIVLKTYYLNHLKAQSDRDALEQKINAYLRKGEVAIQNQEWDLATIAFQEALLIDPNHATAQQKIAWIEQQQTTSPGLLKKPAARSQTLKIYENIQQHLTQARQLAKDQRLAAALDAYKKALSIAQHHHFDVGDIAEAVSILSQRLTDKTNELLTSVDTLVEMEKYDEAYAALQKLLTIYPRHPLALKKQRYIKDSLTAQAQKLYSQAVVFESLPDIEAAKKQWEKITHLLSPTDSYYKKAKRKLAKYFDF